MEKARQGKEGCTKGTATNACLRIRRLPALRDGGMAKIIFKLQEDEEEVNWDEDERLQKKN